MTIWTPVSLQIVRFGAEDEAEADDLELTAAGTVRPEQGRPGVSPRYPRSPGLHGLPGPPVPLKTAGIHTPLIFIIFAILNKFCQQCTIICFVCSEKNKNCKTEKKLWDIFCSKVKLSSHGMQLWKFAVKITKKEYLTRVFPLQNKKTFIFCETFQFWGIQCSWVV